MIVTTEYLRGCKAQWVTFLKADPRDAIPAPSHTFVEIDHESLLPSAKLFKKGCCQLQAKVN